MANSKYYYTAEISFGDGSAVIYGKYKNFEDAVPYLNKLVSQYGGNNVVYCKIQKRLSSNNKEFSCDVTTGLNLTSKGDN